MNGCLAARRRSARIARRDAIALAYISQLILTSQTAMTRQRAAPEESVGEAELGGLIAGLRQASHQLASLGTQQSAGVAPEHATNDPQRAA
jgi:hypothetical protein